MVGHHLGRGLSQIPRVLTFLIPVHGRQDYWNDGSGKSWDWG